MAQDPTRIYIGKTVDGYKVVYAPATAPIPTGAHLAALKDIPGIIGKLTGAHLIAGAHNIAGAHLAAGSRELTIDLDQPKSVRHLKVEVDKDGNIGLTLGE